MIHPGTATHTETRGKGEITTYILIVNACIWEGLESTEYLLLGSGSQNKRARDFSEKA